MKSRKMQLRQACMDTSTKTSLHDSSSTLGLGSLQEACSCTLLESIGEDTLYLLQGLHLCGTSLFALLVRRIAADASLLQILEVLVCGLQLALGVLLRLRQCIDLVRKALLLLSLHVRLLGPACLLDRALLHVLFVCLLIHGLLCTGVRLHLCELLSGLLQNGDDATWLVLRVRDTGVAGVPGGRFIWKVHATL